MNFIDADAYVSETDQLIINELLYRNDGVGIVVGHFDEKLSIKMISGLALTMLGFHNASEAMETMGMSLLSVAVTNEKYIRDKLSKPDGIIWGGALRRKDGKVVSVRICNDIGMGLDGEKLWYMSVRSLDDLQYDAVTGEFNRYGFIKHINEMKNGGADLTDYVIIYINIKGFKAINELYGSDFGDQFLILAFNHFADSAIGPVACARKESDKFIMLAHRDKIEHDRMLTLLRIPYKVQGREYCAESVGGIYNIDDSNVETGIMIDCAKMAADSVTDAFVSPFAVFCSSMRSEYINHSKALAYFDEALENNEFKIYYQPVLNCEGKVTSAEALVRWETENGIVPPSDFIPALEENGCISRLDEYVLRHVLGRQHARIDRGLPVIPISINVSRMDFFDRERTQGIYDLLDTDEVARRYICFEITETSLRSIKELQEEFIKRVNAIGGLVYIDDFGTANSSIDMLAQYDFDVLKMDMQFVREMVTNLKVRALIESTILMGHRLGMKVIAEGVETEEQFNLLKGFQCDRIQGYYFSPPIDEENFGSYVGEHINI